MDDRTVRREALLEAQSAYDRGECPWVRFRCKKGE